MSKKTGKLRKEEIEYISDNRDKLSPEEVAKTLGRNVDTIHKYYGLDAEPGKVGNLKSAARWEEIKKHFTIKESEFFRQEYDRFTAQSEDEFLPAEEAQLIHALTLWILINRSLSKQKEIETDLQRITEYKRKLEQKVDKESREFTENEIGLIRDYREDIKSLKFDLNGCVTQLTEFSKERNNILKQLKMTRDQRVEQLQSGKETFVGLMRALTRKEVRDKEGRRMELLRLSLEKEADRLGKFFEYPDGTEGQPLLSSDTVGLYDKDDKDENSVFEQTRDIEEGKGSLGGESNIEDGSDSKFLEDGERDIARLISKLPAKQGDGDKSGIR